MTIDATNGNDVLSGDNTAETISGLDGIDVISGAAGNDTLSGGDGADALAGGAGVDSLDGHSGSDVLFGGATGAQSWESLLTYVSYGGGYYTLDSLALAGFDDDGAVDVLTGGSGDDRVYAGLGDSAYGGTGNDTIWAYFHELSSGLTLDLSTDPNAALAGALGASVTGFEVFNIVGSDHADTITAAEPADPFDWMAAGSWIVGGAGGDTLTGGAGGDVIDAASFTTGGGDDGAADTIEAGDGSDTVHVGLGDYANTAGFQNHVYAYFTALQSGLSLSLSAGSENQGLSTALGGTITNFDMFSVIASQYDDTLQVDSDAVETVWLGAGNDLFEATLAWGDTTAYGQDGDDQLTAVGQWGYATFYGGDGADTLTGGEFYDTFHHANGVTAGAGLASLDDGAADTISTGSLGDYVHIGLGDSADGGDHSDLLFAYFVAAASGVSVDLSTNASASLSAAVGGVIANFETYRLFGSDHADTFVAGSTGAIFAGADGADVLTGGAGNDTLYDNYDPTLAGVVSATLLGDFRDYVDDGDIDMISAAGGNDTVTAGLGDLADGGTGTDRLNLHLSSAVSGVTIDMSSDPGTALSNASGGAIAGFEQVYLAATHYNDTITGGSTTYAVYGLDGDDQITLSSSSPAGATLVGGRGSDTLTGNDLANVIMTGEAGNSGSGASMYTGLSFHMDLDADVVSAGGGNDVILAGHGDSVDGGAGTDALRLYLGGAASGVTIDMSGGGNAGVSAGTGASISGIEQFSLFGTLHADTFTGDSLLVYLDAGGGNDIINAVSGQMVGADGDDTITALGSSYVNMWGGDGDDTITAGEGSYYQFWGEDGDDLLVSGSGGDQIVGDDGSDTVSYVNSTAAVTVNLDTLEATGGHAEGDSLGGIENLTGSAYNDTLTGDANANTLEGGVGADVLHGEAGDDVLRGDAGDDILRGGSGADVLIGGDGLDTASYSDAAAAVSADLGSFGLAGDAAGDNYSSIEVLEGSAYNDTLSGDDSDNTLIGLGGDDTLSGGGGNDTLEAGPGRSLVEGGSGDDIIRLESSNFRVDGGAGYDTLDLSEAPYLNTLYSTAFSVNWDDPDLDGAYNIELIIGSAFTDAIQIFGSAAIRVEAGEGDDEVFVYGSGQATLVGGAGRDTLMGGSGDDLLEGGSGGDYLEGGDGYDTVTYVNASSGLTMNFDTGVHTGDVEGDTYYSVEWIVGSSFNDTIIGGELTQAGRDLADMLQLAYDDESLAEYIVHDNLGGGAGDDSISGGLGNDALEGGEGADTLDGGAGIDQLIYSGSSAGVTVDLSTNIASGGDAEGDTISGFEGVTGSAHNDTIAGNSGANYLAGGAGDDILSAGDGDDTLSGGLGNDALDGGDGFDTVSYADAVSGVTVYLSGGTANGGAAAGDSLTGIEAVTGSAYTDRITGGSGNDRLEGGGARDVLAGGSGADTLHGGDGDDSLHFDIDDLTSGELRGGAGLDWILNMTTDLLVAVPTIDMAALEAEAYNGSGAGETIDASGVNSWTVLYGNGGNDTFIGGARVDFMYGGDGDDTMTGNAGADVFEGGDGNDTVTYAGSAAGVVVDLSGGVANSGGAAGDSLTSIETVIGSAHGDRLTGGSGADRLEGGGSRDILTGGAGADTLLGGDGDDSLHFDVDDLLSGQIRGGSGLDWILNMTTDLLIAVPTIDMAALEAEAYAGSGAGETIDASGVNSWTVLYGNGGNDTFIGGARVDFMYGGDGDDVMTGNGGADVLEGGSGNDTFVLAAGAGTDIIRDFSTSDDAFDLNGLSFTAVATGDYDLDGFADDTQLSFAGGQVSVLNVTGLALGDWNALVTG